MESASDACESSFIFGSEEAVDHPCCICVARYNKDAESVKYCTVCAYYLCPACTDWHANMPTMAYHQVLNVSKSTAGYYSEKVTLPRQQCQFHDGRILDLFCPTHDQLACVLCAGTHHKNCRSLHYIPRIAVGTKNSPELGTVKLASKTLLIRLKDTRESQVYHIETLNMDEAKNQLIIHEEIGRKLHQSVNELVKAGYDKIVIDYKGKKDQVRKSMEAVDDHIKHVEASDKNLSDFQKYNDADAFVIMKQAKKHGEDGKQLLSKLSTRMTPLDLPEYRLDGTIDTVLAGIGALGYFEQRVTVTVVQKHEYDVKTTGDTEVCHISDACLLVDGSVVITDWTNKSLKHMDDNGINRLDLEGQPSCVCCTSTQTEVAVTLPYMNMVQLVSIGTEMNTTRSFNIGKECRGICFNNGEYFLCCGNIHDPTSGSVRVFDDQFISLRTLCLDRTGRPLFGIPRRITVSPDNRLLHVADKIKGVLTLDRSGNLLAKYSDMSNACGICTITGGDLLVCKHASNSVIHMASSDKKVDDVLPKEYGVAGISSLCYDEANSRLIICAQDSDTIPIVDLHVRVG